ncbi:MAG: hypothetical protein Q8N89_04865 [Azonexus sp.]|nr:hypothetical protein [Azonexus sp.]
MDTQNLSYALVQLAHNFGAVAVTGGAVAGWLAQRSDALPPSALVWLVLAGWIVQTASGAGFGLISLAYYGQFPDLHGVAVAALVVKLSCATAALILSMLLLKFAGAWSAARRCNAWSLLVGLAATALSAAAFLRWFA